MVCTLKAYYVRLKLLENSVPVLESVPSASLSWLWEVCNARTRTDDIEGLFERRSSPRRVRACTEYLVR